MKVRVLLVCYPRSVVDSHQGPVRAIAIHPTRALLATGGDDYKIKVWGMSDHALTTSLATTDAV